MDPEEHRRLAHDRWEDAAAGWARRPDALVRGAMPVSMWMLDAVALQPGQRVLEVACGPGDVGLLAAEQVRPGGTVLMTDFSRAMLDAAEAHAAELGVADATEFREMDAEWLDLPTASVDAVLCRWGFMLLVDPAAALREARRVLRPGGRIALAAWAAPEENPWTATPWLELRPRGFAPPADPDEPTMFSWAADGVIAERLEEAGFVDVRVEPLPIAFGFASAEDWWDTLIDCSPRFRSVVADLDPATRDEVLEACARRLEPFRQTGGELRLPGLTWVAAAEA